MTRWIFLVALAIMALDLNANAQQLSKEDLEREKKFQERAGVTDTTKLFGWSHGVVTGANLTQVSFTNWTQGGENALSYTLWMNGNSVQNMESTNWSNTLKLAFGQTRLGIQGVRKTDDEIYFETLLIYKYGLVVNPYAAATARTQFARGYKYDAQGNATAVSKFLDPGFFTQSVGAAYTPIAGLRTRLGAALREVVTSEYSALYAGGEKTKVWGGLESVTDADLKIAENMLLTSRLELFAPFKTLDQVYVRFDNSIAAKVNDYISVSFNVQLINDVTVTRRTQVKEVLAIGLSYQLI
jgi:hypothetical protein